jgi:preprotein translocase subunit SecF
MQLFKNTQFNFLRWRWPALAVSAVIITIGVATMATRGIPRGVEFSGGTNVIVRFESPVTAEQVRAAVESVPGDKVVQRFGEIEANEWLIRLPQSETVQQGGELAQDADQVVQAIRGSGLPAFELAGTESVGPTVGSDLQQRGVLATILSIAGITLYIAFRFRPSFAIGSLIATFHDVVVTLTCLALFNYEVSLNVIAAMLTMVGYSVNDMIVIFDRVRENTRGRTREPLESLINTSLNQTLTRTVITSGTTCVAVLCLYLFGGPVLEGFAFTMLAGIIATTYSGWFIAPSLAIMLSSKTGGAARPSSSRPSTQAAEAPAQQPTRKSKPARTRAS